MDLKTSCGRILLELLDHSDTVRYQLKIKTKSHLELPVSDKALHDTLLAQFHCKIVAKSASGAYREFSRRVARLEFFKENRNCCTTTIMVTLVYNK